MDSKVGGSPCLVRPVQSRDIEKRFHSTRLPMLYPSWSSCLAHFLFSRDVRNRTTTNLDTVLSFRRFRIFNTTHGLVFCLMSFKMASSCTFRRAGVEPLRTCVGILGQWDSGCRSDVMASVVSYGSMPAC